MLHVSHACVIIFFFKFLYLSEHAVRSNYRFKFVLVSHHTVAALFVPPHRKMPFESILARSVFRTLASGSSDMYRMEYFAVGMRDSNLYANARVWRNRT